MPDQKVMCAGRHPVQPPRAIRRDLGPVGRARKQNLRVRKHLGESDCIGQQETSTERADRLQTQRKAQGPGAPIGAYVTQPGLDSRAPDNLEVVGALGYVKGEATLGIRQGTMEQRGGHPA